MSNNSGVEINGMDEILANLEQLNINVRKVKRNALTKGAEIVDRELVKATPIEYGTSVHMKDNVVYSNMRKDKATGGDYVFVAYSKAVKHRVHVVEFGTIKQPPQNFIQGVLDKTRDDVQRAITNELKGALRV